MNNRVPIPRKSFYQLTAKQKRRNLQLMINNGQQENLRLNINPPRVEMLMQVRIFILVH